MTDQHPITPPPKLVQEWASEFYGAAVLAPGEAMIAIATQAARWGADQELEACASWVRDDDDLDTAVSLRAARRPLPISKARALSILDDASDQLDAAHENSLRRALESLPE
jgi:hypothetical protein